MDQMLDIDEIQVLVHYPEDAEGFEYHHRIVSHRVSGGVWLTLTPGQEIVKHDLNPQRHRLLDRRSVYPEDIADQV